MKLGFLGQRLRRGFIRATRAENRLMRSDGRRCSGCFQPRWDWEFPTQAQVAAWAWGSAARAVTAGRFSLLGRDSAQRASGFGSNAQ